MKTSNVKSRYGGIALLTAALWATSFCAFGAVTPVTDEGQITAIRNCNITTSGWRTMTFFKLDTGTWFGLYTDYFLNGVSAITNPYYASGPQLSLVLLAYSRGDTVDVRASSATTTACSVTATMLWGENGDYLHIGD